MSAMEFRPGYLELRSKLSRLVTMESCSERARLIGELEAALANVEASQRILARWDSFSAVVDAAECFLRATPGGYRYADEIRECREKMEGQP